MGYFIYVFRDLLLTYKTWAEFESFLTSTEGGKIRCAGEGRYRILRYVKGVSNLNLPHVKWMRSVVWDTQTHLPVCIAPPKAEADYASMPSGENLPHIQDFLDGMMINAFCTQENPTNIQIATRSQVGANGTFYSKKTFATMLDEALQTMGFTKKSLVEILSRPTEMVPSQFLSLVLQHPEHRVVSRCRSPRLWLVHTGAVLDDGTFSISEDYDEWPFKLRIPSYTVPDDPKVFFETQCEKNGWFYQGITVKDRNGHRWRFRNPRFQYLRNLRGGEADPVDRFLRLRSESKISEYLRHYGEDRDTFWNLEETLRRKTHEVFRSYCSVHKSREKKLEDLPWEIRPCVFKLHSHYLEHLRSKNEKLSMQDTVHLVNNLLIFEQKRLIVPPA